MVYIKKRMPVDDEERDDKRFLTYDIGLASALMACGYRFYGLDNSNPNKTSFVFYRDEYLEGIIQKYWEDTLKVKALTMFNSSKVLKGRLFMERNDPNKDYQDRRSYPPRSY